jgi:hypothetical protein
MLTHLHMVVLVHLRRRRCLRGGEVWRLPLPPTELARQVRRSFGGERTIGRCIGRWLRSHRTHPVAYPRCCAVRRLYRHIRQSCIGCWLNTVQLAMPANVVRGRKAGEHRTRWRVQCTFLSSGSLLDRIRHHGDASDEEHQSVRCELN